MNFFQELMRPNLFPCLIISHNHLLPSSVSVWRSLLVWKSQAESALKTQENQQCDDLAYSNAIMHNYESIFLIYRQSGWKKHSLFSRDILQTSSWGLQDLLQTQRVWNINALCNILFLPSNLFHMSLFCLFFIQDNNKNTLPNKQKNHYAYSATMSYVPLDVATSSTVGEQISGLNRPNFTTTVKVITGSKL